MSVIYYDSSAINKLLLIEERSDALISFTANVVDNGDVLTSCALAHTEVRRALLPKLIVEKEIVKVLSKFTIVPISANLFIKAGAILAPKTYLRSLDAIHIAVAMSIEADCFVTYDERQSEAAGELGLNVISPGLSYYTEK